MRSLFNSFKTKQKSQLHSKYLSYQKLDVYSIGFLFSHLIYEYYTTYLKNNIKIFKVHYHKLLQNYQYINDFITLFKNMTNINVEERYTMHKSFKIYTELLKTNKLL